MSDPVSNLRATIVPKSDQLNAEQLISGPMTIRVTGVSMGSPDQPVCVHYEGENGRPYKPCKTMRKVLVHIWGENGHAWAGRSMTLYHEPDVSFGGIKVGGIRIRSMSHLVDPATGKEAERVEMQLTEKRGKKALFVVNRLTDELAAHRLSLETAASQGVDVLRQVWEAKPADIRKQLGKEYLDGLKAKAAPQAAEEL